MKIQINDEKQSSLENSISPVENKNENTNSYDEENKKEEINDNSGNDYYSSNKSTYTISDLYVFRCGKVGPCSSLDEVLR